MGMFRRAFPITASEFKVSKPQGGIAIGEINSTRFTVIVDVPKGADIVIWSRIWDEMDLTAIAIPRLNLVDDY